MSPAQYIEPLGDPLELEMAAAHPQPARLSALRRRLHLGAAAGPFEAARQPAPGRAQGVEPVGRGTQPGAHERVSEDLGVMENMVFSSLFIDLRWFSG